MLSLLYHKISTARSIFLGRIVFFSTDWIKYVPSVTVQNQILNYFFDMLIFIHDKYAMFYVLQCFRFKPLKG